MPTIIIEADSSTISETSVSDTSANDSLLSSSSLTSPNASSSKTYRVLLEWIFSLRQQLSKSRQNEAKLKLEKDQLRRANETELVQLLSRLQRDAERVNRVLRTKDERIVQLRSNNEVLRKHLEQLSLTLQTVAHCSNCAPKLQTPLQSVQTQNNSATTLSPSNSSSGSKFGKNIIVSIKKRIGTLSHSTRKLKAEHRNRFMSSDQIATTAVTEQVARKVEEVSPTVSKPPVVRRKNRVSISDPPTASDCLVAAAQVDQRHSMVAKSCQDIISLSEEAELENSVSPLAASVSEAGHLDAFNEAQKRLESSSSSHDDDSDSTSFNRRRHSALVPNEDVKRCFGTRQTRYSRRNFNFKRRYSSTFFIKPSAISTNPALGVAGKTMDDSQLSSPTISGLTRSRSSPEAADSTKLRTKLSSPPIVGKDDSEADKESDDLSAVEQENLKEKGLVDKSPEDSAQIYQSSPRMVGSHSFSGREVLVV